MISASWTTGQKCGPSPLETTYVSRKTIMSSRLLNGLRVSFCEPGRKTLVTSFSGSSPLVLIPGYTALNFASICSHFSLEPAIPCSIASWYSFTSSSQISLGMKRITTSYLPTSNAPCRTSTGAEVHASPVAVGRASTPSKALSKVDLPQPEVAMTPMKCWKFSPSSFCKRLTSGCRNVASHGFGPSAVSRGGATRRASSKLLRHWASSWSILATETPEPSTMRALLACMKPSASGWR
mmetsp:Transcript_31158/g.55056  ORF Transcript_31158/g.55056 Transcript_31158/m.55056 type:complete len:238 (+) Transcript_31158:1863-2576(+)